MRLDFTLNRVYQLRHIMRIIRSGPHFLGSMLNFVGFECLCRVPLTLSGDTFAT